MTSSVHNQASMQKNTLDSQTFVQKHGLKMAALAVWGVLIASFVIYTRQNNIALNEIPRLLETIISMPLFFVTFYALRPILFFPASILTIAGGAIFGPIGVLYTVIGSNASAMLAFFIGRFFGGSLIDEEADGIIQRYSRRLRDNSFETILIMRFIYLPYDLVNYLGGLLRVDWKAFLLATAVGAIPGTIFFTLAGASFENLDKALSGELPDLNPLTLGISISMFVISLILSRYFKRRESKNN